MWKQRSAGGASAHFCVFEVSFLREVLREYSASDISWFLLGGWAAVSAKKSGRRIVYSPFVSGITDFDIDPGIGEAEMALFTRTCAEHLPDARFYSCHFNLTAGHGYEPISEPNRRALEQQMFAR